MSWEAVYVIEKVWQLFSKHRVSKVVSSVWWRSVQTELRSVKSFLLGCDVVACECVVELSVVV